VVYDLRRNRAYCLSPVLASIWRACDGASSVRQIRDRVTATPAAPIDASVVAIALERLGRARLVDGPPAPSRHVPGRRAALQKLAAFGGVTLVSLAAPSALQAASCTPAGACVSIPNSQCTGLPCCENTARICRRPGGGANCSCF
jgi:hypothetical protein